MEVAQALSNNPRVANIYQMTGLSTLHMHVHVEDFAQLENFINSFKGIVRVDSQVLLRRIKSRNGLKLLGRH